MPYSGPLSAYASTTAQRVLDRMAEATDPIAALAGIPTPPRGRRQLEGLCPDLG